MFTLNFSTPTRLRINGHLEVRFCAQAFSRLESYSYIVNSVCLVTAVAELLDNAVDEVIKHLHCFIFTLRLFMVEYVIGLCSVEQIESSGATKILVDKVIDNRNGSPALLVQGSDN